MVDGQDTEQSSRWLVLRLCGVYVEWPEGLGPHDIFLWWPAFEARWSGRVALVESDRDVFTHAARRPTIGELIVGLLEFSSAEHRANFRFDLDSKPYPPWVRVACKVLGQIANLGCRSIPKLAPNRREIGTVLNFGDYGLFAFNLRGRTCAAELSCVGVRAASAHHARTHISQKRIRRHR
jgi:hypothetical protein